MAIKIFFGNYKGGVGKTTSTFQIGINMAQNYSKKVLLLDLDPQASLSKICMKLSDNSLDNVNIECTLNYLLEIYLLQFRRLGKLDILSNSMNNSDSFKNLIDITKKSIIKKSFESNGMLSFIPTRIDIPNARINDIAEQVSRYSMGIIGVAKLIEDIEQNAYEKFDYILIDCPPSLNSIIQAIFLKSDYYLIPTIADDISISGVMDYIRLIERTVLKYTYDSAVGGVLLEKIFSKPPKLLGILETMLKPKSEAISNSFLSELNSQLQKNNIELFDKSKKFTKSILTQNMSDKRCYIFENSIYYRDNKSDKNNLGIPYTTMNAQAHEQYDKITKDIIEICEF